MTDSVSTADSAAAARTSEPDAASRSIRRAAADDAAGIAAVLNEVMVGGRHSVLDTPFSAEGEREFIESLGGREIDVLLLQLFL